MTLVKARRRGGAKPKFGPDVYEALLARVRAGESLRRIRWEPGQPGDKAIKRYRAKNPRFSARLGAALSLRPGAPVSDSSAESMADDLINRLEKGERVAEMTRTDRSAIVRVRRLMACRPDLAERWSQAIQGRGGARVNAARLNALLDVVSSGETVKRQSALPRATVQRYARLDEFFSIRLADARQAASAIMARRFESRRLSPNEIYTVVESAVRNVPLYARDDIRGDLMVALLEGRATPENASATARQLVTAWNRQFARRDASLDADLGDGFTLGSVIGDRGAFDTDGTGIRVSEAAW